MRVIDRQIRGEVMLLLLTCSVTELYVTKFVIVCLLYFSKDIQREEEKVKRSIKDAAKKGQKDVCIILAKEMIHSKKAINKLYASKAQMNSVLLSMKNQLCE